ncbi:MAG: PhoU domain-containing protein, partial [Clostridia bacterium]|nr:PhoU domain-containing protein [Clostridia bacterium]
KMITDMERIGDQAADIAEITGYLKDRAGVECDYIEDMASAAISMVSRSVDAFVRRDTAMAREVVDYDDVVDDLFDKVKLYLIDMISNKPGEGESAIDLIMIAKYFERIGDHATNIAQWVVFSVTGVHEGSEEI